MEIEDRYINLARYAAYSFFSKYRPSLITIDDLVSSSYKELVVRYRNIDRVRYNEKQCCSYLVSCFYGSMFNDLKRQRKYIVKLTTLDGLEEEMHPYKRDETIKKYKNDLVLNEILDVLCEIDRQIIMYRVKEGLTHKAIGDILGVTKQAVNLRYQNAIKLLRRRYGKTTG